MDSRLHIYFLFLRLFFFLIAFSDMGNLARVYRRVSRQPLPGRTLWNGDSFFRLLDLSPGGMLRTETFPFPMDAPEPSHFSRKLQGTAT